MTFLILDIGSSSIRAMLFDNEARLLPDAMARRSHQFVTQPEGASMTQVDDLRAMTEACIDEILAHPRAADIRGVGMTTFVSNMLGVAEDGRPITPVYTYADTQCAEDAASLKREIDVEASHQRTGCLVHPAYWPARLRWLQRTQPTVIADVHRWMDVSTYLYEQWFGQAVPCSYSVAAWSGLLNRASLAWDETWLSALNLTVDRLPALADYTQAQRGLAETYASRWPTLREVPFYLAIGDGAAANVGSGALESGIAALTVGTTAAFRIVSTEALPPVPAGLWSYRIGALHHLVGGATSEGGSIFQWARDVLNISDRATIEAELARAMPDAHGLTVLPLLAGERSPGWALDATGTIHGLRLSTRPMDILQACLEGVSLRLAAIAQQVNLPLKQVMASGAALEKSPAWVQMMADALARPIVLLAETELAARGTALLLLTDLTGRSLTDYAPQVKQVVDPRPAGITAMQQAQHRQQTLYQQLYKGTVTIK